MFLVPKLSVNFEISLFWNLDQFSHLSLEIRKFNFFNQILIGLFDVLYAFHDCIWVVYNVWHIFALILSQILL